MRAPRLLSHCCDRVELYLFYANGDVWYRKHRWPDGMWKPIEGPPYHQMRLEFAVPATKRRASRRNRG